MTKCILISVKGGAYVLTNLENFEVKTVVYLFIY